MFSIFLEYTAAKKRTELVYFIIKMQIIVARVIITATAHSLSVFLFK